MARFAWWQEASPDARRALVAASFGWMLDSFDVMLYAMVLASLMSDLGMAKTTAGLLGSLTLVASAAGRPRLRRLRRPLRPAQGPDGQHPHLFDLHRGLRLRHGGRHAGRLPGLPRPGHGRGMGQRRFARLRDLAGRTPRQGPGHRPELVGGRLCRRGRRRRARPAPLGLAGRLLRRRHSRRSSPCGSSDGSKSRRSGEPSARRPRASGRASARSSAGSACA